VYSYFQIPEGTPELGSNSQEPAKTDINDTFCRRLSPKPKVTADCPSLELEINEASTNFDALDSDDCWTDLSGYEEEEETMSLPELDVVQPPPVPVPSYSDSETWCEGAPRTADNAIVGTRESEKLHDNDSQLDVTDPLKLSGDEEPETIANPVADTVNVENATARLAVQSQDLESHGDQVECTLDPNTTELVGF
jgi:hypothetical protein